MKEKDIEKLFFALKEDIDHLRDDINARLDKQDQVLRTILDLSKGYDLEVKEVKASILNPTKAIQFEKVEFWG